MQSSLLEGDPDTSPQKDAYNRILYSAEQLMTSVTLNSPQLFQCLFRAVSQPVFIIDLSANTEEAKPILKNTAAAALIRKSQDIFARSNLTSFNGSLREFISSARNKVAQETVLNDILCITNQADGPATEVYYNLTATTFETSNDGKMLGIVLMEVPDLMKQEINAMESFKSSLVSALSHELNTPLNSLIPLLRMMPSFKPEGDHGDDLKEVALTSALLLESKIRDLIDYTKNEMDDFRIVNTEFFVDDLFEELEHTFKFELENKKNTLIYKVDTYGKGKMLVMADRNRVSQVLVKLISNANKYTHSGNISLTATESKETFDVMFSVKDTGIGISQYALRALFSPLNEKSKQFQGSAKLAGLGLNIAKSICEHMDSSLKVTSEEGKGTKFTFELPMCRLANFEKSVGEADTLFADNEDRESVATDKPMPKFISLRRQHSVHSSRITTSKTLLQLKPIEILPYPGLSGSDTNSVDESSDTDKATKGLCHVRKKSPTAVLPVSSPLTKSTFYKTSESKKEIVNNTYSEPLEEEEMPEEPSTAYNIIPRYHSKINSSLSDYFGALHKITLLPEKEHVVLIADDQYANRMVLREMLKRQCVKTIEAIDGKAALEEVEKSFRSDSTIEIVLILMDLNMPVMSGIESTVAIRELEHKLGRCRKIPIVAVTAQDSKKDRKASMDAGMQRYITKPVDHKTLENTVREYASSAMRWHSP